MYGLVKGWQNRRWMFMVLVRRMILHLLMSDMEKDWFIEFTLKKDILVFFFFTTMALYNVLTPQFVITPAKWHREVAKKIIFDSISFSQ